MKITIEEYNNLHNCGHADIVGQCDDNGITYDIINNYADQRTDHCLHVDPLAWMYIASDDYMAMIAR